MFDVARECGPSSYRETQSKIKDFFELSVLVDHLQLRRRLYGPD
jgi:hypothetical protein